MTPAEQARFERVKRVLPALREAAVEADAEGAFPMQHVQTLRDAGLLGLIVPEAYGGLGGGLRDLCAATSAMASACPSTALCFFFHCSSASRGLLPLEAIDKGLFDPGEAEHVRPFAEKLLRRMGEEGKWLGNFASEGNKNQGQAITVATRARRVEGGWRLTGEKSFGCATGVADYYVTAAAREGSHDASGIGIFLIPREAEGVSPRIHWDSLGLRATATDGLKLQDVFVPDAEALTVDGAFLRMMQVSRGSFVGNQIAGIAVYLGGAQAVFDHAVQYLCSRHFGDTGASIAESPMHQELIGKMTVDLETAYLWLRRQLELESSPEPKLPKERVVAQWRMCKGEVTEACFRVAQGALKACGTGNTMNKTPIARALRDLSMGLVQAFPAERGRLEVAKTVVGAAGQAQFGVGKEK